MEDTDGSTRIRAGWYQEAVRRTWEGDTDEDTDTCRGGTWGRKKRLTGNEEKRNEDSIFNRRKLGKWCERKNE
jgi:hypothetical protein